MEVSKVELTEGRRNTNLLGLGGAMPSQHCEGLE